MLMSCISLSSGRAERCRQKAQSALVRFGLEDRTRSFADFRLADFITANACFLVIVIGKRNWSNTGRLLLASVKLPKPGAARHECTASCRADLARGKAEWLGRAPYVLCFDARTASH